MRNSSEDGEEGEEGEDGESDAASAGPIAIAVDMSEANDTETPASADNLAP